MNVFTPGPQQLKPASSATSMGTALVVSLLCLAIGVVIVIWRTSDAAAMARACARAEVLAQASIFETQLNQAVAAAEKLAWQARQAGGSIPGFQRIASELMTSYPAVASLQLQPGGVVSEIFPKPADTRVVGLNVLKHPIYGTSSSAALQNRTITVSDPVPLYSGALGIVVTAPVFRPGKDGRDVFVGFAAASLRMADAAARAGLDDLSGRGYRVLVFAPARPGRGAIRVAGDASRAYDDPVVQSVKARNLQLTMAIQPGSGWIAKTDVVLDSLAVLALSCLAGLLVLFLGRTRDLRQDLQEANQRVARDQGNRNQVEENMRRAQEKTGALESELARVKASLQQAEAGQGKLARLEAESARANESILASEARAKQIEQSALEMQARLEAALRTTEKVSQGRLAELEKTRDALTKVQAVNQDLQTRLEAASQAQERHDETAKERFNRDLARIDELQNRLEALKKSAAQAEEASAARIAELEKQSCERSEPLKVSEQVQERAGKPAGLPSQAAPQATNTETTTTVADSAPDEEPAELEMATATGVDQPEAFTGRMALPEVTVVSDLPMPPVAEEHAEHSKDGRADDSEAKPDSVPGSPERIVRTRSKPAAAKPARKRRAQRDNQMDLFAAPGPGEETAVDEEFPSRAEVVSAEVELAEASGEDVEEPAGGATEKGVEERRPRRLPAAPPMDQAEFRQAVNVMIPLLADGDPGAKDCLKDNRATFRSGFHPEAFEEFEDAVKSRHFAPALEQLKKAAKRHGVSV